jgi:hypothetical protein
MAFKMNNSPVKLMWPWSKKAREKRRRNRAYKDFEKATEVRDGKTYDKPVIETKKIDYSKLTPAELEAMRNK